MVQVNERSRWVQATGAIVEVMVQVVTEQVSDGCLLQ